jgi:hypothetical protein
VYTCDAWSQLCRDMSVRDASDRASGMRMKPFVTAGAY